MIHGEEIMKSNLNLNFGVENEIIWCVAMCEIEWIMLTIYYVKKNWNIKMLGEIDRQWCFCTHNLFIFFIYLFYLNNFQLEWICINPQVRGYEREHTTHYVFFFLQN